MNDFPVSPEDCLILTALNSSQSLREAARLLSCDPAGLMRKVQRIADQHGLVKKIQGRWKVTGKGLLLIGWTQETIRSQKRVLLSESTLRIASTAWFSERLLIPSIMELNKHLREKTKVQFTLPNRSFETALLEGECDFVIICHPPENPAIAHKQILPEKWSMVISPRLAKTHRDTKNKASRLKSNDLSRVPYIHHEQFNPEAVITSDVKIQNEALISADNLIGVRAGLLSDYGWSLVPTLLVKSELEDGALIQVGDSFTIERKVCLWWLRHSPRTKDQSTKLVTWLTAIYSAI